MIQCLEKARKIGLTLNSSKCQFRCDELTCPGHTIPKDGISADANKVRAIAEMTIPEDKKAVQSLLGMINYVRKFIPNLAEITKPLRELLKKEIDRHWNKTHEEAVNKIKELLISRSHLAFFDPSKAIQIQVDASKSGIGAVLMQNGKPVSYTSRSLTNAQKNNAIIEKELLAVLFGCERFHQFVYGSEVTIISDHRPLESITKKPLSKAPARLQQMLLRLQRFNMNLLHKPGKDMDTLSRAHLKEDGEEINEEEINAQIHMICSNAASDEKTRKIQEMTQKDDVLQQLKIFITNGWPKQKSDLTGEILSYWSFQEKLSVINGTIYKGHRIVIPKLMRQEILENLHQSHMGISKTKARARETVYWPNINRHIEMLIKKCEVCQTYQKQQQKKQ